MQNLDYPFVDITKPLDWPDNCMEAIFLEHVIEHVPPPDAFRFMREAYRILKPGGILRLAFPDVVRIYRQATPEYLSWLATAGYADGTLEGAVSSIILNHGHQGVWTEESMEAALSAAGFDKITAYEPGDSENPTLRGLERHGSQIGEHNNWIESCCMEAVKPMRDIV